MSKEGEFQDEVEVPGVTATEAEINARAAQMAAHKDGYRAAFKRYPKIFFWIGVMLWMLILMGFDNSAGGQVLSIPKFRENFGGGLFVDGNFLLSASWQSAIQAGPTAMNVVGLYVGSYTADHLGKRIVLFAAICISFAAIGVEYSCKTIETFFAGKMVNGFALGIMSALCVSYVAEISPLSIRGIATGCCNLSQTIGPFIGSILGNYVGTKNNDWSYKSLFVAQWLFGGIAILVQPWMPESPAFYLKKGKEDKARKQLRRLCSNEEDAEDQLNVLKITLYEAEQLYNGGSYIQCFKGTNLRRTLLAGLVFFTHPMSGVSFNSSYGPFIYQLIGISAQESFRIGIGAQVLSMGGTIASFFIIDRFGRRPLILCGLTALMINLLCTGITGTQSQHSAAARTACVAFLTMFNFWYNGGIGAIAYAIASEIPTSVLRTKTVAIALSVNQGFGTMWTFVLPFIINPNEGNLGPKVGFIFFALSMINLVLLYLFLPEIAHRTFEELDELFANHVPAREFKKYITAAEVKAEQAFNQKGIADGTINEKQQDIEMVEHA
ncbi:Mal11p [Sugiyamaella lignohabitans]|uniref:Mal11p n=1 Tax=Sugiyamaella lignohabitans TaxID=796027 RepID=A0A167CSV9_9ASCO|nr:Mal11p [Sugiyamaella lignohabitans]ANB12066.1 Mal11p [Sugiyamaella lignohabitans]